MKIIQRGELESDIMCVGIFTYSVNESIHCSEFLSRDFRQRNWVDRTKYDRTYVRVLEISKFFMIFTITLGVCTSAALLFSVNNCSLFMKLLSDECIQPLQMQ